MSWAILVRLMELDIDSLTLRGYGAAPLGDRKSVEVAGALPGEQVRIELKTSKQRVKKGRLLEVLRASPDRVPTRCAHAHQCGGCALQHLDYRAQLRLKEQRVRAAFAEFSVPVEPILGMADPWRYRNKMEFTFSENRGGTKYLGLMIAQAEPYVFNLDECHLCSSWFADSARSVRAWWEKTGLKAYYPHRNEGLLRYLTLRESQRTGERMAILNLSTETFPPEARASLKEAFSPDVALFIRIHNARKGTPTEFIEEHLAGPTYITESVCGLTFRISPSSFFQPNTLQAELLYRTAMSLIAPGRLVYDLYCGTGTLGMIAAATAHKVIGIDLSAEAIRDAQANAERNGLTNLQFEAGDVGKVLTRLQGRPDVVIVDPPRAGLDPLALHHLQLLKPQEILYISCNPLTQVENIRALTGYELVKLQPVDQFAHTYHIENIALLRAK